MSSRKTETSDVCVFDSERLSRVRTSFFFVFLLGFAGRFASSRFTRRAFSERVHRLMHVARATLRIDASGFSIATGWMIVRWTSH